MPPRLPGPSSDAPGAAADGSGAACAAICRWCVRQPSPQTGAPPHRADRRTASAPPGGWRGQGPQSPAHATRSSAPRSVWLAGQARRATSARRNLPHYSDAPSRTGFADPSRPGGRRPPGCCPPTLSRSPAIAGFAPHHASERPNHVDQPPYDPHRCRHAYLQRGESAARDQRIEIQVLWESPTSQTSGRLVSVESGAIRSLWRKAAQHHQSIRSIARRYLVAAMNSRVTPGPPNAQLEQTAGAGM